ncbi:glutamate--cysteine ligase [Halopiger thermotolerans]
MHTSLEVDYWTVDSDGDFAPAGPIADAADGIESEPRDPGSLLTVTTPPCESIAALRRAFVARLEAARSRAATAERRLVPLATPINGDPAVGRDGSERSRVRRAIAGTSGGDTDSTGIDTDVDGGLETNGDRVPDCAGARIRVERTSPTDQLNALLALTPALALVNSTPYLDGDRVAAGARTHCYRERFGGSRGDRLCRYVESTAEWRDRLAERYERVKARAVANGVDATAVDEHLSPVDAGWTPVRVCDRDGVPSTLEWRAPDAALPRQLLRLAEDVATVMDRLRRGTVRIGGRGGRGRQSGRLEPESDDLAPGRVTSDGLALPRATTVADLVDAATYEGLESTPLAAYLERMGFSVGDYHPISARIDGRQYVTRADARELRLEYAGLLEADVAELAGTLD